MCVCVRERVCVCTVSWNACVGERDRQRALARQALMHVFIRAWGEAEANRSIITSEEHSLTDANPRQERGARQKERGREKDRDPLQNQLKPN